MTRLSLFIIVFDILTRHGYILGGFLFCVLDWLPFDLLYSMWSCLNFSHFLIGGSGLRLFFIYLLLIGSVYSGGIMFRELANFVSFRLWT